MQREIDGRRAELIRLAIEADKKKNLQKYASTILSRWFSHLTQAFNFKDADRWQKLGILRSSGRLSRQLKDMQDFVLSPNPDAAHELIEETVTFAISFEQDVLAPINSRIDVLIEELKKAINSVNEAKKGKKAEVPKKEKKPKKEPVQEPVQEPDQDLAGIDILTQMPPPERLTAEQMLTVIKFRYNHIENAFNALEGNIPEQRLRNMAYLVSDLGKLFTRMADALQSGDKKRADGFYRKFVYTYNIFEDARVKADNLASKVREEQELQPPSEDESEAKDMEKVAGNPISRTLRRIQMGLFGGDGRTVRLSADRSIQTVRKLLNDFMDKLEKRNVDFFQLANIMRQLAPAVAVMLESIARWLEVLETKFALMESKARRRGEKIYIPKFRTEFKNNILRNSKKIDNIAKKFDVYGRLMEELDRLNEEMKKDQEENKDASAEQR